MAEHGTDIKIVTGSKSLNEQYVMGEDVQYTTGEIATILNMNRDMVRYYGDRFEEFLNVTKTMSGKGGHRRYTSSDIETLRTIISLNKDRNMSVSEIKQALRDPDTKIIFPSTGSSTEQFTQFLIENSDKINEYLGNVFQKHLGGLSGILEENLQLSENANKDLLTEVNELRKENETIKQQLDDLKTLIESKQVEKKGFFGLFKK